MRKLNLTLFFSCVLLWSSCSLWAQQARNQNFLSVQGNKLVDSRGKTVRLTGVNWFGMETNMFAPHGLWVRDMKSVLKQIKDLGFNCIRLPWCDQMLDPASTVTISSAGRDPYTGVSPMNQEESTKRKPIEIMDIIVDWCQKNDMKLIFDNHSRKADGFLNEPVWYTNEYSEEKWIANWVFLANRYKNQSAVVGMDLDNEPHGSTWGNANPESDWNKAAERCGNAILAVNPNVLIVVEGVGKFEGETYWWGGQLKGAQKYPVVLSKPNKLMYSPHEYGPEVFPQTWFSAPNFPNNMPGLWTQMYGYLYDSNTSPLLIGEFGIKNQNAFGGIAYTWFTKLMDFAGDKYNWTFWCMNPNSGDTGGLFKDDWTTLEQWKLNVLLPHVAPTIPNEVGLGGSLFPKASFTSTGTAGNLPFAVSFDASASSDPDGDLLTYAWDFGNGSLATGKMTAHTFTTAGDFAVKLTVSDPSGNKDVKTVVIHAEDFVTNRCNFNVPLASALSSVQKNYNKLHILGINAPNLSNVTQLSISWNAENNALYSFAMNTSNGQPNWYLDIRNLVTYTFNTAQPSVTFVNTGFAGLDKKSYWAALDGDNFVLVSKDKSHILYFSNSPTQPSCNTTPASRQGLAVSPVVQAQLLLTPNPSSEDAQLLLSNPKTVRQIRLTDMQGKVLFSIEGSQLKGNTVSLGKNLSTGIYLISVEGPNETQTLKFVKN